MVNKQTVVSTELPVSMQTPTFICMHVDIHTDMLLFKCWIVNDKLNPTATFLNNCIGPKHTDTIVYALFPIFPVIYQNIVNSILSFDKRL